MRPRTHVLILLVGTCSFCVAGLAQVDNSPNQNLGAPPAQSSQNPPNAAPSNDPWAAGGQASPDEIQTGTDQYLRAPARSHDRSSPDDQAAITVGQLKLSGKARGALSKAWVAIGKEKLADAARYVEKALTLCPKSAEALTFRAALKAQDVNTRQEAKADAEKAVEYDPNLGGAYVILGSIYSSLGQFDDAVRTLDRGIALLPTQWAGYYEMSIALLGKQDYVGGLRQAEKASRLEGKNYPPLHLVKAYAYMGLKNRSAAENELHAYQSLDPDNPLLTQARKTFKNVFQERETQVELRP